MHRENSEKIMNAHVHFSTRGDKKQNHVYSGAHSMFAKPQTFSWHVDTEYKLYKKKFEKLGFYS